jgi:hypothetical protein
MKIVLPKTLAEPLTIGWPEPYDHGQISRWIIEELIEEFQSLDDGQLLPSSEGGMSIAKTCDHLRWLATMRGAEDISTTCMNINRNAKWVGYTFIVRFSEPGKSKRHDVCLKTYF